MERHDLAWAAGFFDGEGWASFQARACRAQINQADPHGIPQVLAKFQRIVGVGRIAGPEVNEGKIDLYHWVVSSRADVARVAEVIGPWLGPVKRAELEHALGLPLAPMIWPGSSSEELAWAGGFFDGEGSTYLLKHRTHLGHRVPVVDVPQSGPDEVPIVLTRLHAAFDGVGSISGPRKYRWADQPVSRWRASSLAGVQLVLHRLWPFVGSVKREQARHVLMVVNSQPDLPRGNPAFGQPGARFCRHGHDKVAARVRPYRNRKPGTDDHDRHLRQCLECAREQARQRRSRRYLLK